MGVTVSRHRLEKWPGPGNTGVPSGTSLTPFNGILETTTDGQVIENLDVLGVVIPSHNNVTIRRCRIRFQETSGGPITSIFRRTGILVEDCELDGLNEPSSSGIHDCNGYTVRRCNIHHCENGIDLRHRDGQRACSTIEGVPSAPQISPTGEAGMLITTMRPTWFAGFSARTATSVSDISPTTRLVFGQPPTTSTEEFANGGHPPVVRRRRTRHRRLYPGLGGGSGTTAQTARGSHYGSMMDCIRKAYPTGDVRPFAVWIENGAPYDAASSGEITPAQMKWAVWASIVHGARQITYFNHTFRAGDPFEGSHNNFNNNGYGGPGVAGTGIYAAGKEINLFALELAPVINSPFDGYLCFGDGTSSFEHTGFLTACTSTNTRNYFAGVDASCKWQPVEGKHYILATTREQDSTTNWPVTYRMVDQGQTQAVDLVTDTPISIERGGGIPGGFCEFDDTFATAASYKAYRID